MDGQEEDGERWRDEGGNCCMRVGRGKRSVVANGKERVHICRGELGAGGRKRKLGRK